MICFCDKEVYCINENEANRDELFSFFIKKEHLNDIVVVYDSNGSLSGIITYKSILHSKTDFIQKGKVKISDTMWNEAQKLFELNNDAEFFPLVNENDELLYFCYKTNEGAEARYIDEFLELLGNHDEKVFINDLYPDIQAVYIYDMNEWAYRFYCCLKERNFPVIVNGEKWAAIFNIQNTEEGCPDFARINLYAEGYDMMLNREKTFYVHEHNFKVLKELCIANRLYIEASFKRAFSEVNKEMIICNFPELDELDFYTPDEAYRKKFFIYPSYMNRDSFIINDQFFKVAKMNYPCFKEAHQQDEKLNNSVKGLDLNNGKTIICNKHGNGKNRIYLIAPVCMANWEGTLYTDSLYRKLLDMLHVCNSDYEIIAITLFDMELNLLKTILESLNCNRLIRKWIETLEEV